MEVLVRLLLEPAFLRCVRPQENGGGDESEERDRAEEDGLDTHAGPLDAEVVRTEALNIPTTADQSDAGRRSRRTRGRRNGTLGSARYWYSAFTRPQVALSTATGGPFS